MKDKIKNIAEKLEHQIRMHELDLNDRIKDIPQIILLLEQGFSELKEIVSFYKFSHQYLQPIITQYFASNKSEIWP